MLLSLSAVKPAVTKYDWYSFKGKRTLKILNGHKEYDLELEPDEVFGVKSGTKQIYLITKEDPSILFKIEEKVLSRLLKSSKGWSGKVGRYKVNAGRYGAVDKPSGVDTSAPKAKPIRIRTATIPENKTITTMLKQTKVMGIDNIKYIMAQELLPGEMYYYYDAESMLRAYQESKGLKPTHYGQWDTFFERLIEKKNPTLDVELGTIRIDNVVRHVMSVVYV